MISARLRAHRRTRDEMVLMITGYTDKTNSGHGSAVSRSLPNCERPYIYCGHGKGMNEIGIGERCGKNRGTQPARWPSIGADTTTLSSGI